MLKQMSSDEYSRNEYDSEHDNLEKKQYIKKKNPNKDIVIITYIFVGLFVLLLGNFTYFLFVDSTSVINNSYNKRQDLMADRITRGMILGSDLEILAETKVDKKGNTTRNYPYDDMFAHVVGRFLKGKTGIESSQNFNLLTSNDNPITKVVNELAGEKNIGDNIVTTLDVDLQEVAYDALGNRKGAIVVLEPSTGKILAMVSKPDYNPNNIDDNWEDLTEDSDNNSALINRATQGLYPPGSTFKIVTALEYIRENSDYEDYSYNCKGSYTLNGVKIKCYNNKKHGHLDLSTAFAKSCNSAFAEIGTTLNRKSYYNLCDSLLFNSELPLVDLSYNKSSFVLNESSEEVQVPQTAIGQGKTQISPIHNALLVAAIANGGNLMKPYVVDRIENTNGDIVEKYLPTTYGSLMTADEADILSEMMQEVVENGTATALNHLGYEVAGKTGSAEFDSGDSSHAWFVGYASKDKSDIVVSIIVEGAGTGSDYAVPIAKKIFKKYFK